jgi:hypothetical protein
MEPGYVDAKRSNVFGRNHLANHEIDGRVIDEMCARALCWHDRRPREFFCPPTKSTIKLRPDRAAINKHRRP